MATTSRRADLGILKRRISYGNSVFLAFMLLGAASIAVTLVLMLVILFDRSWSSITEFGPGFFTSSDWNPVTSHFGAAPAIYGTVASSLVGLAIAVPISIGVAIFLSEVAPRVIRVPVSFLVEMLAAVPSVVFGLWGLFVLAPIVRDPIEKVLGSTLGWIPIFDGPRLGVGILAAGMILAIMVLPIITAISRDVMRAVPQSQREAALALGATKWEMIWSVVLPYARPGIMGAVILGLGRAVGETLAVTMLIGNAYKIKFSLFAPSHTLASTIASEFREAADPLYQSAIIELGLVLMAVTLVINILARVLVWRISQHAGGDLRL
jgi:phosphate transport system permease protein